MSQRVLIVGTSESGKSSLARKLIVGASLPIFVRDPVGAEWPGITARFATSDELRLLIAPLKGSPCVVIIDESMDFFRVGQVENHWIFTRGRHAAMLPIAIAHRVKMIAPNVREQASDLYVLNSGKEASEILAEEYNSPKLLAACDLEQGAFFHVRWRDGVRLCTLHHLWKKRLTCSDDED